MNTYASVSVRVRRSAVRAVAAVLCLGGGLLLLSGERAGAAGSNVVVTKTGPSTVAVGATLRYEINIVNNGSATLQRAFLNDTSIGLGSPRVVSQPQYLINGGTPCVSFPCDLWYIGPGVRKQFVIEYDLPPCPSDRASFSVSNSAWVTGVDDVALSSVVSTVATSVTGCPEPTTTTTLASTTTTTLAPVTTTTTTLAPTTTVTTIVPSGPVSPSVVPPASVVPVAPATTSPAAATTPPSLPGAPVVTAPPASLATTTPTTVPTEVQGVSLTNVNPATEIAFTGRDSLTLTFAGGACVVLGLGLLVMSRPRRRRADVQP